MLVLSIGSIVYINSLSVEITDDDLPQNVYGQSGNLNMRMNMTILQIVQAEQGQADQHIEDFINLNIYKTIRDDINEAYDPILGDTPESQYIIKNAWLELDYIYAELMEDQEVKLTVSLKRDNFPKAMTAVYFYFDMNFSYSSMKMKLTLNRVVIDDQEVSRSVYDRLVGFADKEMIENSVDKGTLDLDNYTYVITFTDLIFGF